MLQCDVLLTTAAEVRKWFMRMQMYMSRAASLCWMRMVRGKLGDVR
jgi:hypothetical protein